MCHGRLVVLHERDQIKHTVKVGNVQFTRQRIVEGRLRLVKAVKTQIRSTNHHVRDTLARGELARFESLRQGLLPLA